MDITKNSRSSNIKRPYISEFLNIERNKLGLTQIDFAKKIGVGLKTIRKIEQGDLNVNFKKLKYIYNTLGLDLVPGELVSIPIDKNIFFKKEKILFILKNILPVFKIKYDIDKISLFGSYAKGLANVDSDIDILLTTDKKITLEQEGEIQLILETLLDGKKVDLTNSKNIRPEYKFEIMETKIDVEEEL